MSSDSYNVSKLRLLTSEVRNSNREHNQRCKNGNGGRGQVDRTAEYRPAETLDHTYHRVNGVNKLPFSGQHVSRVSDRTGEEPYLNEIRNHVLDVSVADIQRREHQTSATGGDERQECQRRYAHKLRLQRDPVPIRHGH